MVAPNIVNVTSIYGKTIGEGLGTNVATSILTCPTDKVLKINSIIVANVDGFNAADVTVSYYNSSANNHTTMAHTISVPADATLVVISKDTSIYLNEGDMIRAGASAAGDLHILISYEELDDA